MTKLKAQVVLAAVITIGFIIITILAFTQQNDNIMGEVYKGILQMLAGAWIVNFTTMVNYHFGSTKGSAEKTEMQNEITKRIIEKKD